MKCVCCGMTSEDLRQRYPLTVRIVKENSYGLPVGKEFPFACKKEGDGSPYPVVVCGNWPAYFHGREYQMRADEVVVKRG